MSTPTSTEAARRREAARQSDGRFGTQQHSSPGSSVLGDVHDADRRRLLARQQVLFGDGAVRPVTGHPTVSDVRAADDTVPVVALRQADVDRAAARHRGLLDAAGDDPDRALAALQEVSHTARSLAAQDRGPDWRPWHDGAGANGDEVREAVVDDLLRDHPDELADTMSTCLAWGAVAELADRGDDLELDVLDLGDDCSPAVGNSLARLGLPLAATRAMGGLGAVHLADGDDPRPEPWPMSPSPASRAMVDRVRSEQPEAYRRAAGRVLAAGAMLNSLDEWSWEDNEHMADQARAAVADVSAAAGWSAQQLLEVSGR